MEKSKVVFLVLTICGTLCVLMSLFAVTYLYHQHAPQFAEQHDTDKTIVPFAFFVAIPSLVGFIIGGILVATGIAVGLKDRG